MQSAEGNHAGGEKLYLGGMGRGTAPSRRSAGKARA